MQQPSLAAIVILCNTKLTCARGRQLGSLLFLIPAVERFRSKASTTIPVGWNSPQKTMHNLALTFAELCLLKMMRGHHVSSFEK